MFSPRCFVLIWTPKAFLVLKVLPQKSQLYIILGSLKCLASRWQNTLCLLEAEKLQRSHRNRGRFGSLQMCFLISSSLCDIKSTTSISLMFDYWKVFYSFMFTNNIFTNISKIRFKRQGIRTGGAITNNDDFAEKFEETTPKIVLQYFNTDNKKWVPKFKHFCFSLKIYSEKAKNCLYFTVNQGYHSMSLCISIRETFLFHFQISSLVLNVLV